MKITTIRLSEETRLFLEQLKKNGETYEEMLLRILKNQGEIIQ